MYILHGWLIYYNWIANTVYSEKVFVTVYPQVVEKVINHILCFHKF